MEIVRTDGGGSNFDDKRLKILRRMLKFFDLKIHKLHDHKGILNVYWYEYPSKSDINSVVCAWEFFREFEINHFLIHYSEL